MNFILTPDHHSVLTASSTQDICYPLFQQTDITAFVYARVFDHGETFGLNTHSQWQLHHFNSGHLITPPIPKNIRGKRISFLLSANTTPLLFKPAMDDFRDILGIDYPYFIIEYHQGYYDLYIFCTRVNNEGIINFYLNEQRYIERFKHYFKHKAKNLLKDAAKHKISIPKNMQPQLNCLTDETEQEIKPRQFILHDNDRVISFTAQEGRCLKYLSFGYDNKRIAGMMGISHRTVEFHLNGIKNKVKITNKAKILPYLYRLGAQTQFW
jgi:DNA-binding CsgD family transcriptional regulator